MLNSVWYSLWVLCCVDMQSRWKIQSVGAFSSTTQAGKTSGLFQVTRFYGNSAEMVILVPSALSATWGTEMIVFAPKS